MAAEKDWAKRKLAEWQRKEIDAVNRLKAAYAESAAANERLWHVRGKIAEAYKKLEIAEHGN